MPMGLDTASWIKDSLVGTGGQFDASAAQAAFLDGNACFQKALIEHGMSTHLTDCSRPSVPVTRARVEAARTGHRFDGSFRGQWAVADTLMPEARTYEHD